MEQACPAGFGMVAVTGLPQRRVEAIIGAIHGPAAPLYLANLNGPAEFVLSGADAALDRAIEAAQQAGARRAERLAVAVPSHCPLMDGAAAALTAAVESVPVTAPRIPMVGNRRARMLRDAAAVREELATNLAHPVRWSDSVTLMAEHGATAFLEMPPGTVLTRAGRGGVPRPARPLHGKPVAAGRPGLRHPRRRAVSEPPRTPVLGASCPRLDHGLRILPAPDHPRLPQLTAAGGSRLVRCLHALRFHSRGG